MLETLNDLPPGVDGLKAIGKVTKSDYETTFEPLIDAARRDGRRLRFLYQLGPEFEGVTAGAVWEDVRVGLHSLRLFEGCAIVSDSAWISDFAHVAAIMMPCPIRVFGNQAYGEAAQWLASLPKRDANIAYYLVPQLEVMVVEVKGPLRARDFEELTLTADAWIEARGELHGLIIRAPEFPGWENFQGFLRHIRFVKDHHREVHRIALVTDSKLASWAPYLADHFVKAELKTFGYEQLDVATAWTAERA